MYRKCALNFTPSPRHLQPPKASFSRPFRVPPPVYTPAKTPRPYPAAYTDRPFDRP